MKENLREKGILTGVDHQQEWMLKWWHENMRRHNDCPLAIADFGMSPSAKLWAQNHAQIIEIPKDSLSDRPPPDKLLRIWEHYYQGDLIAARKSWFYKPFALQKSPFEKTIWLDLDCEIKGDLRLLFNLAKEKPYFAACPETEACQRLAKDLGILPKGEIDYNSGVLVFHRESPVINKWALLTRKASHKFMGDQNILSHILHKHRWKIQHLPEIYNWHPAFGIHEGAKIIHYVNEYGKREIFNKILSS